MILRNHSPVHLHPQTETEKWGKRIIILFIISWGATPIIGFKNVVAILTLSGFIFSLVGLRKPSLGLIGISVLCTLDILTRSLLTNAFLPWNTLNYWLLLVIFLSAPLLLRLGNVQVRLLFLFLVVLAVGLLFTPDFELGVLHILSISITFGILAYFTRAINDLEAWYWSAAVCGWLSGLGGLAYYLDPALTGAINPNAWAFFPLTAIFCICLVASLVVEQKRMVHLLVLAFINIVWVFLSSSRGDLLIGIVCGLILVLIVRRTVTPTFFIVVGMLVILVISNQFEEYRQSTISRITKTFDIRYTLLQRTSGRSDYFKASWYIFLDNPFGVGTGGFSSGWSELGSMEGELTSNRVGREAAAHSGWAKVLAENGLPGILLLVAYVFSFAIMGWRNQSSPLVGLLVTSTLAISLIATEFQSKGLWYLAAGAMVMINRQSILEQLADWDRRHRKARNVS